MKVLNTIWDCICYIAAGAVAAAWSVTFGCITFGLAIWSFNWLMGMI